MSFLILDSGKRIDSSTCLRFQNWYENQDNCHIKSYDLIKDSLQFTDYFLSEHTGYSDYSGAIHHKSNQKLILEEFKSLIESGGILEIYGHHGYSDILIRLDALNENKELQDILFGLDDYAVIDEMHLSEIEEEAKQESWRYVERDFLRLLNNEFNYDLTKLSDEFIVSLFNNIARETNVDWYFEYAEALFPLGILFQKLTRDEFLDIFKETRTEFTNILKEETKELYEE